MLKNLFISAYRSLLRNKAHALLNLAGLTLGITCCLMIFLLVRYELSFDTFHAKADRIYRITTKGLDGDRDFMGTAPFPVGEMVQAEFPEVEKGTSTMFSREGTIKVNEKLFKEEGISYVAPSFFELFDYEWVAGDPELALADPYQVVLTESVARRYFGGEGASTADVALGKVIRLNNKVDFQVTGIVKDFPDNTDFPFRLLLSYATLKAEGELDQTDWLSMFSSLNHYVLLKEGADIAQMEARFPALLQKYLPPEEAAKRTHLFQPLREVHSDDRFGNYNRRTPTKTTLYGLSLVGLFLLLTACINFINLATAQSVRRSKEVGVRKVMGANRSQLVRQFMAETALLTVLAVGAAGILVELLFPFILDILGVHFSFGWLSEPVLPLFLVAIAVLVVVLAGFYPALVLSGFQPILALKNKGTSRSSTGGLSLRRGLIVFQFVISQVLIIGTLVVARQLDYFRSQPLGFAKEAIVTVPIPETEATQLQAFRHSLQQIAGIQLVSLGRFSPSSQSNWEGGYNFAGSGNTTFYPVVMRPADPAYLQTFGLTLLAGRNVRETDSLSTHVVANEALLRQMGIRDPQEAVGRTIEIFGDEATIVGVVKDFHTHSLRQQIKPTLLFNDHGGARIASLKMNTRNISGTLAQVEQVFRQQFPASIYAHQFLDETIASFYKEEEKLSQLFTIFSGIAIFIGCLGLYGLISFMAEQRTKEIGVRKVLGASLAQIVLLFTKEFFALILIAFLVAAPLAWYLMQSWLQDFEYRITPGPELFLLAVGSTLLLAALAVGYRSVRAALANPVESLRSE